MKTKIYLTSLLCIGFLSCDDSLNVEPETFVSGSVYYKNADQVESAVNGVYSVLQNLHTSQNFWMFTETRSDNTTYQYNINSRCCITREQIDEFLNTSTDRFTEGFWNGLYNGVQQTNVIIDRIDGADIPDQIKKNQFIGEAKFIRGLLYFHLVRLFGEIPLRIEEVKGPSDAFTETKASREQVYNQIILDLQDAVTKLPEQYGSTDVGRATKGAALTLLGDVYLTLKDYTNTIETLKQVTQLGYQLVPNYANIFDPNNKNNSESIFEIQFNSGVEGEASNFIYNFGPFSAEAYLTGFQGQLGGLNIPTPSLVNAYEVGDKRKDASIGYYSDPVNSNLFESFPGDSIPYTKKYNHPPYEIVGRTNDNWPVYRYAGALLMLAEALNEEGRTGEAEVYLNLVRLRARLAPISGLGKDAFRDAVYHEERVELAFEDKRWYDLLRTDRAIEVMTQHGIEERNRLARVGPESFVIDPFKLVFPIPETEIRLNGFEQNPGY
jgi:hypothetical protein